MNSKIYRCGWCGNITQLTGELIHDQKIWNRISNLIKKYGDGHTEKTHGDCCRHEYETHNFYEYK